MKKIQFSKNDAKINSGIASKLKVAALAIGLTTAVGLTSCGDEACDTGSNADYSSGADTCDTDAS
ncbi:MAG: hypothetical protein JXR07_18305 [Reichenbachiella sp.]